MPPSERRVKREAKPGCCTQCSESETLARRALLAQPVAVLRLLLLLLLVLPAAPATDGAAPKAAAQP